jgi:hypothetical protein
MTILSGLIFSFVISNSVNFSLEPILGSIYEHARPDVRQDFLGNLNQMCETLKLLKERPEIQVEIDPSMDLEELTELCERNLEGKEFFVEFTKTQIGSISEVMGNNQNLERYYSFLDLKPKNGFVVIGIAFGSLILLYFTEENYTDFLKTISKILLSTSLFLFFIYLTPKIMGYFIDVDTSFMLEMDQEVRVISQDEVILVLLPIIIEEIFTEKLIIYSISMLTLSLVISLAVYAKNKLITVKGNNKKKMSQMGP